MGLVPGIAVGGGGDTDGDGFSGLIYNFPLAFAKCRNEQATIMGTEGPDVIMGLGGADIIYGHGDDDLICAGKGKDTV